MSLSHILNGKGTVSGQRKIWELHMDLNISPLTHQRPSVMLVTLLAVLTSAWLASGSQCINMKRDFRDFGCCINATASSRCGETTRENVWSQLFGQNKGISGNVAISDLDITLIPTKYSTKLDADRLDENVHVDGILRTTHTTQKLKSTSVSENAATSVLILGGYNATMRIGSKRYKRQQVKVGNITVLAFREETQFKWGLRLVPGCFGPSDQTWVGISGQGCVPFFTGYLRVECTNETSAVLQQYTDASCTFPKVSNVRHTDKCFENFTVSCRSTSLDDTPRPPLALIDLYHATDGENWEQPWDLETDYCEWSGVQCTSGGGVVGLILENRGLSGFVPDSIATLVDVQDLWMNNNDLSGTIPPLDGLSSLYTLDLSSNHLTGGMPRGFSGMTNLEFLSMSDNHLSGPISPEILHLTELWGLDLSLNKLNGTIPEIDHFKYLEYLLLFYNNLSGTIPDWTDLPNLIFYGASYNNLTGPLPTGLYKSNNLETVQLSGNGLTGTILRDIHKLPKLTFLNIAGNLLSGSLPPELGQCSELTYVNLAFNQLTGRIPDAITNLTQLKFLNLRNNSLSGDLPLDMGELTELTALSLRFNQLQGNIPNLTNLENLEFLYLGNNNWTSEIPFGVCQLLQLVKSQCILGAVTCPDPGIQCQSCQFNCEQSRRLEHSSLRDHGFKFVTELTSGRAADHRPKQAIAKRYKHVTNQRSKHAVTRHVPVKSESRRFGRGGRGVIGGMISTTGSFTLSSGGGSEGPM